MTKEELKQSFIHGNLAGGSLNCDEKTVDEGIATLGELITKATTADSDSKDALKTMQNLKGFYGVVQNNCLSEDNLFYDLDIPSYTKDDNTEHIVEDFNKYTEELVSLVATLKSDIEHTVNAIKVYNNRDSYSPKELAAAAESISLFDDYERLGDYTNKYTDQQFNGSSGGKSGGSAGSGSVSGKVKAATTVPSTVSPLSTTTEKTKVNSKIDKTEDELKKKQEELKKQQQEAEEKKKQAAEEKKKQEAAKKEQEEKEKKQKQEVVEQHIVEK